MRQKFMLAIFMSALLAGAGVVFAKPALLAGQKDKAKAEKEEA
jgi:hypothetical protein